MIKGLYQTLIIVIGFLYLSVSIKTFFYFYFCLDFFKILDYRIHNFPITHLNVNHILVHKLVFFYTCTVL